MADEEPKPAKTPTYEFFLNPTPVPHHVVPDRRQIEKDREETRRAMERAAELDAEAEIQSEAGRQSGETRRAAAEARRDIVRELALATDEQFWTAQTTWASEIFDAWPQCEAPPRSTIVEDIRALQNAGRLPACVPKVR